MDRNLPPFADAARDAFPARDRALANAAIDELIRFVDDDYRMGSSGFIVSGQVMRLPTRLNFSGLSISSPALKKLSAPALCLLSRSTDGYLRQRAVVSLLGVNTDWAAPYVVTLMADYVHEIVEVIHGGLPSLEQTVYANFVRENRPAVRVLRERTISYWNAYYRAHYPRNHAYPGLKAIRELELWAA